MENTNWYKELQPSSIILGYRGSIVHGTYRPSSEPNSIDDKDIMGVYIAPIEHYFGLGRQDTIERMEGEWDVVSYELVKFVRLLLKSNPNVLSLLWMEPRHYIKLTRTGELLKENRRLFLSKQAYHSYCGYAYSQLHKMEKNACQGYMGEKRKRLVEKHGYDTKNASHLIRLLRQGIELLALGELKVHREDNAYLVDIKNGKYTIDQIKDEAKRLFSKMEDALIHSSLPAEPDKAKAEELLVKMLRVNGVCCKGHSNEMVHV